MANFVSYSDMSAIVTAIGNKFSALMGAYVPKGNVTFANLPATPSASNLGFAYNVTDKFTTDSRFVEGSGKTYPAGTNVVVIDASTTSTPDYKFDIFSGFIDLDDIYAKIAAAVNLVAPAFSATADYAIGDYVIHSDSIWKFTAAHTAGAWVGTDANEIGDVTDLVNAVVSSETLPIRQAIGKILLSIAGVFDETTAYLAGEYIWYNEQLYKFNTRHTPGPWNDGEATLVLVTDEINAIAAKINTIYNDLAEEFSESELYDEDDIVRYQGLLYKFVRTHSGSWYANDVTEITIGDVLEDILKNVVPEVKKIKEIIAYEFDESRSYNAGDYVIHDGYLYCFQFNKSAGPWDSMAAGNSVTVCSEIYRIDHDLNDVRDDIDDLTSADQNLSGSIADVFSPSKSGGYTSGELVMYNNKLYVFNTDHTGPWTGSDASETTIESLIEDAEPESLTPAQISTLIGLLG